MVRNQFIGVWRLVSCERTREDGRVDFPYGDDPLGRISYDEAGRMSAQLMRRGRRTTVGPGMNLATAGEEEIREAVAGYAAYFGTFDVDEAAGMVIHHVEASLVPSWVGTDLRRKYRFFDNRLALTAALPGMVAELIWEREPDQIS